MAHDHHHDHDHDHGHHHHAPADFGPAFAIGTALNLGFVAVQIGYGLAAHSLALLADAAHNFGDVLGLIAAWWASHLARRGPTQTRSYGYGRGTILASLANAVLLLLGCGAIAIESVQRLAEPAPVAGTTVMIVAAIGIAINGGTALMFMRGRHNDLNIRGAFLHMLSDALVSAGVVAAGLVITITGWTWLDPLTSLAITAIIVAGTWGLLRESSHLAMDGVPPRLNLPTVQSALESLPGVAEVHDLHIWSLSTTSTALTAHLVQVPDTPEISLQSACHLMAHDFAIGHCTFQIESHAEADACILRPAEVI
jgi:cobalt-zinc-cadmium efflux system protein